MPDHVHQLRDIPLFHDLPDEQLRWVIENGEDLHLSPGETLFVEGDAAKGLYVLLDGELRVTKQIGGQEIILGTVQRGSFVGEISLMTGSPHTATAQASKASHSLKFAAHLFHDVVNASPILNIMLKTMAERLHNNEVLIQQHQKLSALGKLSAGLAHELNNPAAAARRAAGQLQGAAQAVQSQALALNRHLDPARLELVDALRQEALERAARHTPLDPLAQSDREDEVATWLDDHNVPDGWQLAPVFVAAGFGVEWLDSVAEHINAEALSDVLNWIASTLNLRELLNEVEQSTTRISELVKAVKSYSYMDQAPVQNVNVNEGLENTLVILRHKLKDGITVIREYDPALPRISAYGSELNQVWTNLIDNAVDALEGKGQIRIRTAQDGDYVLVEIADNGPGIPPEIQSRIFEPFFTTKPQGKGTGMGLDIVYRTIAEHHRGDVRVNSKPGETCFQIRLPIRDKHPD